jgi:diacylglycerol kinase family enzyme
MSHTYAVFYSPSVSQKAQLSLLHDAYLNHGLAAEFYPVEQCQSMADNLTADVLVAAGGDGTVNTVAAAAYRLHKPLGIVPLGTLNHFAKDLGLPLVLMQAVGAIAQGRTIRTDIGMCNDLVFLNNMSIGLYPSMVHTRTRFEKPLGKWLAACMAVCVVATRRLRLYDLRLVLDGKARECRSSLLFVGNNEYEVQGRGVPTRENLWSGTLHAYALKTKRVDRLVRTSLYGLLGKRLPERYIDRFQGTTLEVSAAGRTKLWLAYDGEITRASLPLRCSLKQQALNVIIPTERS